MTGRGGTRPRRPVPWRWTLLVGGTVLAMALIAAGPPTTDEPAAPAPGAPDPSSTPVASPVETDRPNVLVVTMDDMRADELAYVPTVRRMLVRRGVRFENSFAPNPLCCPSRASFLLGQYSHHHGVLSHVEPYGFGSFDDSETLAGRLQEVGYRTGFVGKYLNGYGLQRSRVTGQESARYVPAGWDDWRAGIQTSPEVASDYHGGTYSYFNYVENRDGTLTDHPGDYSSTVISRNARALVRRYAAQDRPWFLWVNPVAPHVGSPVEPDDPAPMRIGDRTVRIETPARPGWVRGRFDRTLRRAPGVPPPGRAAEADTGDKPPLVRRQSELPPRARAGVLELARQRAEALWAWDRSFARVLGELRATGQWSETVVVFTSDNGFFLGEHRIPQGKIWSYEESIRVPLIVAGPGIEPGRRYFPAMTQDLTATLLDLAGAELPADRDGESLVPVLTGDDRRWDRAVVVEGFHSAFDEPGLPAGLSVSGVRTGRWKLVHWSNGFVELYNLGTDPLELDNLAASGRHREIRRALERVWRTYADCRGAACRRPLDARWRVSPEQLAAIAATRRRERSAHYGDAAADR